MIMVIFVVCVLCFHKLFSLFTQILFTFPAKYCQSLQKLIAEEVCLSCKFKNTGLTSENHRTIR